MRFSSRTPNSLDRNAISRLIDAKRNYGATILDLTVSNPTRAGLDYPQTELLAALSDPGGLTYEPDPRGLLYARERVAGYCAEAGARVDPERIVLTASTSEAYAFLFKLLCEPGDRVAVPVPSYPLFEHLARVECAVPVPYPLLGRGAWRIDFDALGAAIDDRTRAVVVVSPNNPTGSSLVQDDRERLVALCAEHKLTIICDEVFADFDERPGARTIAGEERVLTFALSGLSKVAALPQVKLGWIVASGPPEVLAPAMARLEFIADLFLSVGTPVQRALPAILDLAPGIRRQITSRTRENRALLAGLVAKHFAWRLVSEPAGWSAVLEGPRLVPEDELVLALLDRKETLVHPGFFFDFESDGLFVVSLVTPPADFAEGMARFFELFAELTA